MTHKKQLVVMAIALVSFVGCGGMRPPADPPDSSQSHTIDASGVWVGWLSPDLFPNAITPLRANVGQGGLLGQMGFTVAMEFVPPQCFALASGTGEGTLKGDQLTMTVRLNDGGTLTIKGRVRQDKTMKGHLQDGTFEMTGECQSKGQVVMDRP